MPDRDDIPSTIKRSSKEAQETWKKTHDSAVEQYGDGRRAHMTAYASLKHKFEKVGDHWEKKDKAGPSDPRARGSRDEGKTYGGVDVEGSSKQELQERARELGVSGRSKMSKDELGEAINKANQRKTAEARSR